MTWTRTLVLWRNLSAKSYLTALDKDYVHSRPAMSWPSHSDFPQTLFSTAVSRIISLRKDTYTSRGYGCGNYSELIFVESKALKQAHSGLRNCFSNAAYRQKSADRNPQLWQREGYIPVLLWRASLVNLGLLCATGVFFQSWVCGTPAAITCCNQNQAD